MEAYYTHVYIILSILLLLVITFGIGTFYYFFRMNLFLRRNVSMRRAQKNPMTITPDEVGNFPPSVSNDLPPLVRDKKTKKIADDKAYRREKLPDDFPLLKFIEKASQSKDGTFLNGRDYKTTVLDGVVYQCVCNGGSVFEYFRIHGINGPGEKKK